MQFHFTIEGGKCVPYKKIIKVCSNSVKLSWAVHI